MIEGTLGSVNNPNECLAKSLDVTAKPGMTNPIGETLGPPDNSAVPGKPLLVTGLA